MEKKITISINEYTEAAIAEAEQIWPELAGNRSAIYRKVILDWWRVRCENGSSRSQIQKQLEKHDRLLCLICSRLGIDIDDDTDHA